MRATNSTILICLRVSDTTPKPARRANRPRPLVGEWPYLWLDATYLKQREGGRIVSVAAIIAVAVNTEGKREIVGLHIGASEAETFWSAFADRDRIHPNFHRGHLIHGHLNLHRNSHHIDRRQLRP
jgi:hypothetical protein